MNVAMFGSISERSMLLVLASQANDCFGAGKSLWRPSAVGRVLPHAVEIPFAPISSHLVGGYGAFPASINCTRMTSCSCGYSRQSAMNFRAAGAPQVTGCKGCHKVFRYSYTRRRWAAAFHPSEPSGQTRLAIPTPIISVITVSPF